MIATPCNQTCRLDPRSGLCEGCGRSGAEIAAWSRMTQPQRLALMALLPARMAERQKT